MYKSFLIISVLFFVSSSTHNQRSSKTSPSSFSLLTYTCIQLFLSFSFGASQLFHSQKLCEMFFVTFNIFILHSLLLLQLFFFFLTSAGNYHLLYKNNIYTDIFGLPQFLRMTLNITTLTKPC